MHCLLQGQWTAFQFTLSVFFLPGYYGGNDSQSFIDLKFTVLELHFLKYILSQKDAVSFLQRQSMQSIQCVASLQPTWNRQSVPRDEKVVSLAEVSAQSSRALTTPPDPDPCFIFTSCYALGHFALRPVRSGLWLVTIVEFQWFYGAPSPMIWMDRGNH